MTSLAGKLLIAPPQLADPNFARTVTLVIRHDDDGALGLVLNRPVDMPVATAWAEIAGSPCAVDGKLHQGGPCEGPLVALHGDAEHAELDVIDGVRFAAHRDHLRALIEAGTADIRCFVGYAGWESGQLEAELAGGAWIVTDARREHVFPPTTSRRPTTDEARWVRLVEALAPTMLHPSLDPRLIPNDPARN